MLRPVTVKIPKGGYGQNILLLAGAGGIGDFILMSPAIREIRRLYPNAHITLVIKSYFMPLAETCPYIDEIVMRTWHNGLPVDKDLSILPKILSRRYDIAFSFFPFADFSLFMYMSGSRTRIIPSFLEAKEYAREDVPSQYFARLSTDIVPIRKYGTHAVDTFLSVVDNTLHAPVENRELEIWCTPGDFFTAGEIIQNLPRPIYALMIGTSSLKRRYPAEKYAELIKMIINEEPSAMFINLGGGPVDAMFTQILQQSLGEEIFSKHVVNLVNKIHLRISAAIFKFCDMYIGNNTVTMHMASAAKCPSLIVECFPKNLDTGFLDIPRRFAAYRVPAVSVQPAHALPECAVNEPYNPYGCQADTAHCITQIEPQTLFKGFKLLKEKIVAKINDTTYISD